jgi:hypothetical protein
MKQPHGSLGSVHKDEMEFKSRLAILRDSQHRKEKLSVFWMCLGKGKG